MTSSDEISIFLALPLELREEVYTHLLLSPWAPTTLSNNTISKEHPMSRMRRPDYKHNAYKVCFPDVPAPGTQLYGASPLLGASRQSRREILAVIQRLQDRLPWRLDLRSRDLCVLEARWTHLPVPPSLYSPCVASFADPDEPEGSLLRPGVGERSLSLSSQSQFPPDLDVEVSKRDLSLSSKPQYLPDPNATSVNDGSSLFPSHPHAKSGHNIVATLHISPSIDQRASWDVQQSARRMVANLLAVVGSWCANGVAFTRNQGGAVPFIDTLTVLLRPPYPHLPVTESEVEESLRFSNMTMNREKYHDIYKETKHQCRHLNGLSVHLASLANEGLMHGYFRRMRLGVERTALEKDDGVENSEAAIPSDAVVERESGGKSATKVSDYDPFNRNSRGNRSVSLDSLYNQDMTVWNPATDGDKTEMLEGWDVIDRSMDHKLVTAYWWAQFGWLPEFPRTAGKIRASMLPCGILSTVQVKRPDDGWD